MVIELGGLWELYHTTLRFRSWRLNEASVPQKATDHEPRGSHLPSRASSLLHLRISQKGPEHKHPTASLNFVLSTMAYAPPSPTFTLLSLSRHQAHLETHIQTLLDAQSAGLLSGLGHDPPSESHVLTPIHTPTSTSTHSPARSHHTKFPGADLSSPTRHQQQSSKPLTLHTARRGISHAIADLAVLKSQESDILQSELDERRRDVSLIDTLSMKQQGLQAAIEQISNQESSHKAEEFRAEEQTLGREILELEERLQQMKNRQRYLLREIQALDNRTQAKLSSYQESLRLAEKEAREWLARPPARVEKARGRGKKEDEAMWDLPKERRTLEMAKEWAQGEEEKSRGRFEVCEKEREALEEGGEVWRDVREIVSGVEKSLRGEMNLQASRRWSKNKEAETTESGATKRLLDSMEVARAEIERELKLAEDKGWRLLVCCIGAELEALIEGMGVLKEALDAAESHPDHREGYSDEISGDRDGDLLSDTNGLDELRESMNGVSTEDTRPTQQSSRRTEDEDDEPGPDLLIAQPEDD